MIQKDTKKYTFWVGYILIYKKKLYLRGYSKTLTIKIDQNIHKTKKALKVPKKSKKKVYIIYDRKLKIK